MKKSLWQSFQPHIIAIGIFFLISCIYCLPAFQGMVIQQHDLEGWKGMAQQSFEYKERYGHYPLWTNSLFSGMPTFQIINESKHNITIAHLHHLFTFFLPEPASLFFLACVGMYILAVVLRMKSWIGILISLAYSFATYSAILVVVGHTTKFSSMAYAPALLAGLILLSQRKYVLGFVTSLLFATLLFFQNHVQIVYYTVIIAICLAIGYLISSRKQADYAHLGKAAGLALLAGVLGMLSYAAVLFPTYDYAKETMRGGRSQLTSSAQQSDKSSGGLSRDYAFAWSYGIAETFTVVVPRIFGGSSGNVANNEPLSEFPRDSRASGLLAEQAGMSPEQSEGFLMRSAYWGPQNLGTSAPVYLGAVMITLFIFGLVFYTGWHKGWLIAATIIGILLAWGKNFSALNYFLFDYLPYYNKFRAPSMALVIPQLTVPVLAGLGLQQLLYGENTSEFIRKKFRLASYIVGGLSLVLVLLYFTLDYKSLNDGAFRDSLYSGMLQQMARGGQPAPEMEQQAGSFASSITNALKEDRRALYGGDLLRSFLFIALTLGILYMCSSNKLKANTAVIALAVLSMIDLFGVDTRYLTHKNYVDKEIFEEVFIPNAADLQIKQDTGYYRVFDQSGGVSPFQSSRASYHHNSVGGYHPAKLGLYNDLIENQLAQGNMQVYNMLNTKYFIMDNPANRQAVAQLNPEAFGPVWFTKGFHSVANADEEMQALGSVNLRDSTVIESAELAKISVQFTYDSAAGIQLLQQVNDQIRYTSSAAAPQFAVFSEVYYPNGWKAFIDGKEAEIIRVNYLLRGLQVPAGNHTIEFKFEPKSFQIGDTIMLIVGIISILALLYGIFFEWRKYQQANRPAK